MHPSPTEGAASSTTGPAVTLEPVHFSTLKHMQRSPAHYAYERDNQARKQKAHERKGSSLHSFLLGGADVVLYEGKRDTRVEKYREFLSGHEGALILSPAEYANACGMRDSIRRNRRAMALLEGEREKNLQWRWLGRLCEGTIDVVSLEHITELKTARTAQPERFVSSGRWYGYHSQLAWYRNALLQSGYGTPATSWIVAVESSPPFPVTVFQVTDNAIELGERACRAWMERLLVCEASDAWPAYTDAPALFDVAEDEGGFVLTIDGEETEVA